MNEIVSYETEDEDTVDAEEFWESVEYNILARIFLNRVIQELEIKPSFNYWAPYIGKYTRPSKIVLNTEHKKVSKINGKFEKDCREMTEEHILDMLTNDSYLKVKNTAKSCKLSTTGSKMDIIMRLKNAIANNDKNFKNCFQSYGVIQGVGSHFLVSTALYTT